MRRLLFPMAFLLLLPGSLVPAQEIDAPPESPSPEALELPLRDVLSAAENETTTLAERRGAGGLLVIFLSNTCPYVLDWAERLPRLATQAAERGVGLALVNSNARKRRATDSPDEMRRFASEHLVGPLAGEPYLLDGESRLADLLGAQRTPEALLFDGELELIYRGPIDDHSGPFEKVEEHWLRDALGTIGSELAPPESRPALGCKIQRPRRRARTPG